MLKKMRSKRVSKKIWIVIAIFILPSFLFWGVTTVFRGSKGQDYAGRINGRYVSTSDFRDALKETRNQFIIRFGDDKFYEIQKTIDLESQAWKRLLLLSEAKRRNIKVSDKEVVELIQSYTFFHNSKGEFNNKRYSQVVESLFLVKPRQFEEEIRNNIMIFKLSEEVTKEIGITEEEVKEEYKKINQALSINYIAAIAENFAKDISVSDAKLEEYYNKNINHFKQPLSFNVEYIALATEGKDREWLAKSLARINTAINKKTDLKELAKELGVEIKETGLFKENDPIPGIGWSPQIFNILSASKTGDYITPLVMDTTYYIFRIKEKKEPYIPKFSEIKTAVGDAYKKEKSRAMAKEKIDSCMQKIIGLQNNAKPVDLSKIAAETGLKYGSTGMFKYGSYIEGIGASEKFWLEGEKLQANEISGIIELPPDFYILSLKSKNPLDEKKFQDEKNDFSSWLLMQKKEDKFLEFVEELNKKSEFYLKTNPL